MAHRKGLPGLLGIALSLMLVLTMTSLGHFPAYAAEDEQTEITLQQRDELGSDALQSSNEQSAGADRQTQGSTAEQDAESEPVGSNAEESAGEQNTQSESADLEQNALGKPLEARTLSPLKAPGPNAVVATVDGLGDFSSLAGAIEAITNNGGTGTIHLVSDCTITGTQLIPSGSNITITDDGAGYSISRDSSSNFLMGMFYIDSGAVVTLEGDVTISLGGNSSYLASYFNGYIVSCNGSFIMNSGTLDGTGCEVERTYSGLVGISGANASFTMDGGKICNAELEAGCGGVFVCDDATFTMNDGEITGMDAGQESRAGSVLVVAIDDNSWTYGGDATFVMNGGSIHDNNGYRGAGVYLTGLHYETRAYFTMNGGSIYGNTAEGFAGTYSNFQGAGAGVFVENNAVFTMNDGSIADNVVTGGMGGGVATSCGYETAPAGWSIEDYSRYYPAGFVMNGGEIIGNSADMGSFSSEGCGGGIYVASNEVDLRGGMIADNYAERQGGGIYIGSTPYVLKIHDAVITENMADLLGGGIWLCPTGDTEIFVTNGVGIFDNASDGSGDDIVSVKNGNGSHILTLSERMLGGGKVQWFEDGGVDTAGVLGYPDDSVPRYGAGSAEVVDVIDSSKPYAIKSITSDDAKALSLASASLLITGNYSPRGGGIGSNGGVVLGEKSPTGEDWTLKVLKVWEGGASGTAPITVYLKAGNITLDSVELNESNGWQAEFTGLPDPSTLVSGYELSVTEDPVPGDYDVSYSSPTIDTDAKSIEIVVTNIYNPALGDLTVTKTVAGNAGDKDKAFAFTVTLDDTSVNGTYGDMEFADGVAELTLKDGESATAAGLPNGCGYEVAEADYSPDGYVTAKTGEKGEIQGNEVKTASFTNTRNTQKIVLPNTGESGSMMLIALLCTICGAVLLGTSFLSKIERK